MTNISIEQLMCISDEQLKRLRSVKNVQQVKLGNFSAADCVFTNAGGIGIVIEVPLNTDTDENAIAAPAIIGLNSHPVHG